VFVPLPLSPHYLKSTAKAFQDIKDFGIDSLAKAKLEPTEQLVKTSHTVFMQEKTEQAKGNAAEEESKKNQFR
jgi:hypothetical protein